MAPLPTLFVSHGAPSLALEPSPAREFLARLGAELPRPRAIVVASAHWLTDALAVDISARPATIHDFSGFPPQLYAMRYPAPGDPALAERVRGLLDGAGLACRTVERGLDHGAWVPLGLMYPHADVPVVALSLQPRAGAAHHLRLGRALAPLRADGVLVVGSGSATHDLSSLAPGMTEAPDWVRGFDDWLAAAVERGDDAALADWQRAAPHAGDNHPSAEHFLPLLVALGAAGPGARGRVLHRSISYGVLSMAAFAFDQPAGAA
jgi:4,5-DOPA dioxygenase extradiol